MVISNWGLVVGVIKYNLRFNTRHRKLVVETNSLHSRACRANIYLILRPSKRIHILCCELPENTYVEWNVSEPSRARNMLELAMGLVR